ncbi:MAG: hypothetical protein AAF442_06935 [Pseudomonadota bacterium]
MTETTQPQNTPHDTETTQSQSTSHDVEQTDTAITLDGTTAQTCGIQGLFGLPTFSFSELKTAMAITPRLHAFTSSSTFQAKAGTTLLIAVAGAGGGGTNDETYVDVTEDGEESSFVLGERRLVAQGGERGNHLPASHDKTSHGRHGSASGGRLHLIGKGGFGGPAELPSWTGDANNIHGIAGGNGGLCVDTITVTQTQDAVITIGQGGVGATGVTKLHYGQPGYVAILEFGS